jgi:hypothetical protein
LWWVKRAPRPGPLVTTGPFDPNTFDPAVNPPPGALGTPGTRDLTDGSLGRYDTFSGLRLRGGAAFDADGLLGIEGGAFLLERRSDGFAVQSDASGQPFLGRPFFNAVSQNPNTAAVAYASDTADVFGGLAGKVNVIESTRLWGAESNLAGRLLDTGHLRLTALAGFRYLDLDESLGVLDSSTPVGQSLAGAFLGGDVPLGSTVSREDSFHTRNQFYGGQVGGRLEYLLGDLDVSLSSSVALGSTQQRLAIGGSTALTVPGAAPVEAAGGLLALPSNIGVHHHGEFSVVPEVGLNVGWRVNSWIRARAGYSFLYWSGVSRPGNDIDFALTRTTIPFSQYYTPGVVATRPAAQFHQTDFWAQGLNFGLELRF